MHSAIAFLGLPRWAEAATARGRRGDDDGRRRTTDRVVVMAIHSSNHARDSARFSVELSPVYQRSPASPGYSSDIK